MKDKKRFDWDNVSSDYLFRFTGALDRVAKDGYKISITATPEWRETSEPLILTVASVGEGGGFCGKKNFYADNVETLLFQFEKWDQEERTLLDSAKESLINLVKGLSLCELRAIAASRLVFGFRMDDSEDDYDDEY